MHPVCKFAEIQLWERLPRKHVKTETTFARHFDCKKSPSTDQTITQEVIVAGEVNSGPLIPGVIQTTGTAKRAHKIAQTP